MKTYHSKPEVIYVVGEWNGGDDEPILTWLTERGYAWKIQQDSEPVRLLKLDEDGEPKQEEFESRSRLAVLGPDIWEHTLIEPGTKVVLRNGRVQDMSQEYLDTHWVEVVE